MNYGLMMYKPLNIRIIKEEDDIFVGFICQIKSIFINILGYPYYIAAALFGIVFMINLRV